LKLHPAEIRGWVAAHPDGRVLMPWRGDALLVTRPELR